MRAVKILLLASILGASLVRSSFAVGPLTVAPGRDIHRAALFQTLFNVGPEDSKDYFQGQAEGRQLWVSSVGSMVSGEGPHGRLMLNFFGSLLTGQSGDKSVNLFLFTGGVNGTGPHGSVSLSVSGNQIFGFVGKDTVAVTVMGSSAFGSFQGRTFQLGGFSNLNPIGVAALLGAL